MPTDVSCNNISGAGKEGNRRRFTQSTEDGDRKEGGQQDVLCYRVENDPRKWNLEAK